MDARAPFASLLFLALIACGRGAPPIELSWPPTAMGRHGIGYEERTLTYVPAGFDAPRTLRLALWYPTSATEGRAAQYMGSFERSTVFDHAPPVSPTSGGFPILLFSHGHLGFAESAYFLCEFFASHGWVVAAPDHTGDTISSYGTPTTTGMYILRPLDMKATLDALYALPKDDPLSGHMGEHVAISGHSFGGYTVFASAGAAFPLDRSACAGGMGPSEWCSTLSDAYLAMFARGFRDPRIEAAIAMAPGDSDVFGADGLRSVTMPVLLATGSLDKQCPNDTEGDRFWAGLSAPDLRINFPRGGHHTFAATCELFPVIGMGDGCGDGFVDADAAHQAIDAYALSLVRRRMFGDRSVDAILDGTMSISSDLGLTSK
jgi:predicted dienelactone hydrolase